MRQSHKRIAYRGVIVALIALAGAILRAWHITGAPLWLDESYTAYAASKGWWFLWHVVPVYETHPPFYYSMMRIWTDGFGDGLASLRSLGLVFGILTIPAAGFAAREAARYTGTGETRAIVVASVLVAVSRMVVAMTREVRPYPILIFTYACAIAFLIRSARQARESGRMPIRAWAGYIMCLAVTLWLHSLGPLYGAALGLAALVLIARNGLPMSTWMAFFAGHLIAGLAYLPALSIMLDQAPTWVATTWVRFMWTGLGWTVAELWNAPGRITLLATLVLAALAIDRLSRDWAGRRMVAALIVLAATPVFVSIVVSALVAPVFIPRTMSAVAVPAILLVALGVASQRGWKLAVGAAAAVILSVRLGHATVAVVTAPPVQDWYAAVRWLQPRVRAGDVIYAYPNEGALPLSYAMRDLRFSASVRPLPTPVPSTGLGWYPTGNRGSVSISRDQLRAIADDPVSRGAPTIWMLRLGSKLYDKGDVGLQEMSAHRVRASEFHSGRIEIYELAKGDASGR